MRRLSNPLALAVLALLYERPMHPYEMGATMRERGKEDSIKLRYGSLYTVIKLLLRESYIEVRETMRETRRPERTIYGITEAGEAELQDWLRELIGVPQKEYPQFEAGLSLLPILPPDEVVGLLERRGGTLDEQIKSLRAISEGALRQGLPAIFLVENDYRLWMLKAEQAFVAETLRRMADEGWAKIPLWVEFHRARKKPGPGPAAKPKKGKSK